MFSGGDWGLQRSGVVFLEGTSDITISGNVFERVDGNAIMVSGWNRGTKIAFNEFAWIGDSCIASWGKTKSADPRLPAEWGVGEDGTDLTVPNGACRRRSFLRGYCHILIIIRSHFDIIRSNLLFPITCGSCLLCAVRCRPAGVRQSGARVRHL